METTTNPEDSEFPKTRESTEKPPESLETTTNPESSENPKTRESPETPTNLEDSENPSGKFRKSETPGKSGN